MSLLRKFRHLPSHKRRALTLGAVGLLLILASPLIASLEARLRFSASLQGLPESMDYDPRSRLLLLGDGEREAVVYTWWACPSCKAFFLERWEDLNREGSEFTVIVKPLHFQAADAKKTATVLCAPEGRRKEVFFRLLEGEEFDSPSPRCVEEAEELAKKSREEWRRGGMAWTPGIVVDGKPLAPSEMRKEELDALFGKGR